MDKLLVVDGSNLLFQMFYGMPARIVDERGKAIHGTLGFVGAFLKMPTTRATGRITLRWTGRIPHFPSFLTFMPPWTA